MEFGKQEKGQAALDFLMTYGWAIALVVIIAATLFALGVFNVSNFIGSKASGFSGIAVSGWQLSPAGAFTLKLNNQAGAPEQVNFVNVTISGVTTNATAASFLLAPGGSSSILTTSATAFGNQTTGTGYTAAVVIGYTDLNAGFNYTTAGTITGTVSG